MNLFLQNFSNAYFLFLLSINSYVLCNFCHANHNCNAIYKNETKEECKQILSYLNNIDKSTKNLILRPVVLNFNNTLINKNTNKFFRQGIEYAVNAKNCSELTQDQAQATCWAMREWKNINELRSWFEKIEELYKHQIIIKPNIENLPPFDSSNNVEYHFPYYNYPNKYFPDYLNVYFEQWNRAFNVINSNIHKDSNYYKDKEKWHQDVYRSLPVNLSTQNEQLVKNRFKKIFELQTENRKFHSWPFESKIINNNEKLKNYFCENIPHGGVHHLHLSGIPDKHMTEEIYSEFNLAFNGPQIFAQILQKDQLYPSEFPLLLEVKDINDLYHNLEVSQKNKIYNLWELLHPQVKSMNFYRFEVYFSLQSSIYNNSDAFNSIYYKYLSSLKNKKTSFIEFTEEFTINKDLFSELQFLKKDLEHKFNHRVSFQHAFYRDHSTQILYDQVKEFLQLYKDVPNDSTMPDFLGLNLIGMEDKHPTYWKASAIYPQLVEFNRTNGKIQIPLTIHAGEVRNIDFNYGVRDALILSQGQARIDHGVYIYPDDWPAMALAHALKTIFNISITSNLKLDKYENIQDHPFLFMTRVFSTTLSPDDPGVFQSSMKDECLRAIELGAEVDDFRNMAMTSFSVKNFNYIEKNHAYKIFTKYWKEFIIDFKKIYLEYSK